MFRHSLHLLACFAVLFATSAVRGQSAESSPVQGPQWPEPAPLPPTIERHASSPIEGALRGEADFVRSFGAGQYNSAAAAVLGQEAYGRGLDNDLKRVATYWRKKELHDYYMPRRFVPHNSRGYSTSYSSYSTLKPKRLNHDQLDPVTGAIAWPEVFQASDFAGSRSTLEQLVDEREQVPTGIGTAHNREVKQTVKEMHARLQDKVLDMDSTDYMYAKKFLDRVGYEAQHPVDNSGLASN